MRAAIGFVCESETGVFFLLECVWFMPLSCVLLYDVLGVERDAFVMSGLSLSILIFVQ